MVESNDKPVITEIEQGPFAEELKSMSEYNKVVFNYYPANMARALKGAGDNVHVNRNAFRAISVMCLHLNWKIQELEKKVTVLMQANELEPLVIDGESIGQETNHWKIKKIVAGTSDRTLLQAILDRDGRKSTRASIEERLKEIDLEPPLEPPDEDVGSKVEQPPEGSTSEDGKPPETDEGADQNDTPSEVDEPPEATDSE